MYSIIYFRRSVSAPVPKGEEVAKEAAGAVGGRDQENTGWNKNINYTLDTKMRL